MKKFITLMVVLLMVFSLEACSGINKESRQQESKTSVSVSKDMGQQSSKTNDSIKKGTSITLTIGDTVLTACLNNTTAAQDLLSKLPMTVKLSNSDNDYCGSINPPLKYKKDEIQHGYRNGDLAFWTAGNDFVIFIDDEEHSANTGNLVIIGKITGDLNKMHMLGNSIEVKIDSKK